MRLKRISDGHYRSTDNRVEIQRVVSQYSSGGKHFTESLWSVRVDDYVDPFCYETKKDAVYEAGRRLNHAAKGE